MAAHEALLGPRRKGRGQLEVLFEHLQELIRTEQQAQGTMLLPGKPCETETTAPVSWPGGRRQVERAHLMSAKDKGSAQSARARAQSTPPR